LWTHFSDIVVAVEFALIALVAYVLVSETGAGGVGGVVEGYRLSQPGWQKFWGARSGVSTFWHKTPESLIGQFCLLLF
jgi:hypothetical protein